MKSNNIYSKISTFLLLLAVCYFFSPQVAYGQDNGVSYIRVKIKLLKPNKDLEEGKKGKKSEEWIPLTKEEAQEYLLDVKIRNLTNGILLPPVDEDGEVTIEFSAKDKFTFSCLGFDPLQNQKPPKNGDVWEVFLKSAGVMLGEAKKVEELKIQDGAGPHIPEARGNMLMCPYDLKVKRNNLGHDCRLIAQPVLYNLTRDTMLYLRPKVIDRPEYQCTQGRLYGFDEEGNDPLGEYISVTTKADTLSIAGKKVLKERLENKSGLKKLFQRIKNLKTRLFKYRKQDTYTFTWLDSVYMENPEDFVIRELRYCTEDYMKVKWDSVQIISVGVRRPLRFLQYDAGIAEIDDPKRVPTISKKSKEESDKADLFFPNGKEYFDPDNEHNKQELAKLQERLSTYLGDNSFYNLQKITMSITSSPEGTSYAKNIDLAKRRSFYAAGEVRKMLGGRHDIEISPVYDVAPWSAVADLLREDSLFEEAKVIDRIVEARPNNLDAQRAEIESLQLYKDLLRDKYMPKLRRMDYVIKYNIKKEPTIEELREQYLSNKQRVKPQLLPEYVYWKVYRAAENDSISESICREALELYKGKSMSQLFAHDLQVYLIRQGRPDTMLLRPFLEKHHWPEVDVAHAVALLKTGHYQSAVNLMHNIPDTKNYQRNKRIQFMKSICGVLLATDKNDPVFAEVAKSSDVNKVAILLYADKNEEAYEEAMRMPDSLAMTHYFRATCLNRLDSKVDDSKSLAKKALKKALEMDPALMQVVERDADVNKLLFDDDEDGKKLFASKQKILDEMLEEDKKRPRKQKYVENADGKQWGPQWKGHHVLVKDE